VRTGHCSQSTSLTIPLISFPTVPVTKTMDWFFGKMELITKVVNDLIYYLPVALMTFFAPVVPLVALVGAAIIGDTFLGVWAAYKRGEVISSKKLSAIVPKMLLYQLAILFGYCVDFYLVGEFLESIISINNLMTKVIAITLLYIEVVSIEENFAAITGKRLFKSFLEMVRRTKKIKGDTDELTEELRGR